MDFSSTNTELWNAMIQLGTIAFVIIVANIIRRKVPIIKKTLMPTAVLGGFLLLLLRQTNVIAADTNFYEITTYHMIALGFIAMSLRVPTKENASSAVLGGKTGAMIVSTYMVQAITGLIISLGLAYTVMPDLFKACGVLLPMAYGQGPGQANNVGTTYEALGMAGGRSFGLSLAAAGYLCACIVGVVFLNIYARKNKIVRRSEHDDISGSVTIDTFQDHNEIPIAESVDKLSIQVALVLVVYLITYLITHGICTLLNNVAPGVAGTIGTLLWGFNFIIGSVVAIAFRVVFKKLQQMKIMNRQYQNNYLLSRISGVAFDIMIVAGIASINIDDLSGYWIPFMLMAVAGGIVTFIYLKNICKKLYVGYENEAFFSMYGMLTGTISSGVLLLREIDPDMETPAANNLVTGSSFGIIFGAPVLLLVSFCPKQPVLTLFICFLYYAVLVLFMFRFKRNK